MREKLGKDWEGSESQLLVLGVEGSGGEKEALTIEASGYTTISSFSISLPETSLGDWDFKD